MCVCYDWTRLSVKRPWGASHHPSNYKHLQKLMRQFYTEYRVSFKNSCLCVCYLVCVCVSSLFKASALPSHTHHPLLGLVLNGHFDPLLCPCQSNSAQMIDSWGATVINDCEWMRVDPGWTWPHFSCQKVQFRHEHTDTQTTAPSDPFQDLWRCNHKTFL